MPPKKTKKVAPTDSSLLEKETMKALKSGPKSISTLKELLPENKTNDAIARTLQRLWRQGKVKLSKGQWSVTTIKVCPQCEGKGWVNS